jgi:hypothetical protein
MAQFRKIQFEINRTSIYGHYLIESNYKGVPISVITTDSEAYDYIDDQNNREKHRNALRHCYYKIVEAYNNVKNK